MRLTERRAALQVGQPGPIFSGISKYKLVCPAHSGVDEGGNSGIPFYSSSHFCVDTSPFKREEWLPLNCCSRGGAAVASTLSTCLASESRSWTGCSVVELNGVRAPSHWFGSRPLRLRARWPSRWVVAHNGPHSNWELRTQAQPCGHKTRSDGLSAHCSHLGFGARHLRAALVRRLSELCPRVLRLLRLQKAARSTLALTLQPAYRCVSI